MRRLIVLISLLWLQSAQPDCLELLIKLGAPQVDSAKIIDFKSKWKTASSHILEQNKHFIRDAKMRSHSSTYFQLENAVLKELNDKILLDKDLVTSLDNYLKADFLKRIQESAVINDHLVSYYIDFKSLRLHLDSYSTQMKRELNALYQQSMKKFKEEVDLMNLSSLYSKGRGLSSDPANWYLAGIGRSNDQANFASRIGRTLFTEANQGHMVDFNNHINIFMSKLDNIEGLRFKLHQQAKGLFSKDEVLKLEVIDILRKVKASSLDEYVAQFQKRIKDRYHMNLSRDVVIGLRDYFSNADLFSPALLIEQRVIVDMSKTVAGNISVDIAGMGARNMRTLMESLSSYKGKDVQQILDRIRLSEIKATDELGNLRKIIERSLKQVEMIRKGRFDNTIQVTGDDLVFFPHNGSYQRRHKIQLLESLSQHEESAHFRIVFLPQKDLSGRDILYVKRMEYITRGEDLEKSLRLSLESKIPFDRLKKMSIAVDLAVDAGSLKIALMVTGGSTSDSRLINRLASEIVSQKNLGQLERVDFLR